MTARDVDPAIRCRRPCDVVWTSDAAWTSSARSPRTSRRTPYPDQPRQPETSMSMRGCEHVQHPRCDANGVPANDINDGLGVITPGPRYSSRPDRISRTPAQAECASHTASARSAARCSSRCRRSNRNRHSRNTIVVIIAVSIRNLGQSRPPHNRKSPMPESVVEAAPAVTASPVAGKIAATNSGSRSNAIERKPAPPIAAERKPPPPIAARAETTAADCGSTEATAAHSHSAAAKTATTKPAAAEAAAGNRHRHRRGNRRRHHQSHRGPKPRPAPAWRPMRMRTRRSSFCVT